jgi:hypothetical protein
MSKRLSRALVLDRSIEFLAQVNDEQQRDQWTTLERNQRQEPQQHDTPDGKTEKPLPEIPTIPPPDRGSKAILFMISAFIIEAIMWGEFNRVAIFLFDFVFNSFYLGSFSSGIRRFWCCVTERCRACPALPCYRCHESSTQAAFPSFYQHC